MVDNSKLKTPVGENSDSILIETRSKIELSDANLHLERRSINFQSKAFFLKISLHGILPSVLTVVKDVTVF